MKKSPTIKAQLTATIVIISLMLAILGWLGINGLNKIVHSIHSIYADRVLPLEQLKSVSDMYAVNIVDTAHKTRNGTLDWSESLTRINNAEKQIHKSWNAYLATELVDEEKRLIAEAEPLMKRANESIAGLKEIVLRHDANALANYTIHELYPKIDPITGKIAELVKIQLDVAQAEYVSSHNIYHQSLNIGLILILASILLASFIGLVLYRAIKGTIDQAHEYFQRLASGDLDIEIEIDFQNELTKILDSAQQMKIKLSHDLAQARALGEELSRIKVALDNVSTSVMIADNQRTIVYANHAAVAVINNSQEDIAKHFAGSKVRDLVGSNIDQFHQNPAHQKKILSTLEASYKTVITMGDKTFSLTANPVITELGTRLGTVVEWDDVTENLALQRELEYQARNDFLTGLVNRRYFLELAEQELQRSQRYKKDLSVLMLDVDHFKKINDTQGHKAGDLVLQHLAQICTFVLREVDVVGRLGGEEFAILLPETNGVVAIEVAQRLLKAFQDTRVELQNNDCVYFTVSIGVVTLSSQSATIDQMLQYADEALYKAKESGRNKVVSAF